MEDRDHKIKEFFNTVKEAYLKMGYSESMECSCFEPDYDIYVRFERKTATEFEEAYPMLDSHQLH